MVNPLGTAGLDQSCGKNQITLGKEESLKLWLKKSLETEILNREEHGSFASR